MCNVNKQKHAESSFERLHYTFPNEINSRHMIIFTKLQFTHFVFLISV